jgi:hypothetical protein
MEITKELLKQKFEEYNKLYFNNELPMCRFTYTYMRDVFGRYMTSITPKGKKMGHIWISKSIDLDEEMLRELLVHEMIHHYVRTIDGVFFDGFFCHGRHFVRQVKRIKKQYGLDICICSPHWHYRNEKPHTSRSTEFIGFLRNRLHLF